MNFDKRDLKDILKVYCERGWHLFPVGRKTKRPAIKNNLHEASTDIDKLMRWAEVFKGCNWGVSLSKSGLVCVDVDEKYNGLERWTDLILENGEPDTLTQQSGSGAGLHYVFKTENGQKFRKNLDGKKGIDVKHNGYIVIFPSVHERTGRQYIWKKDCAPKEIPAWLLPRISKTLKEKTQDFDTKPMAPGFFEKIISQIKTKALSYDEWVSFGMALHSTFEGSDEGLNYFLNLTENQNFTPGDLEQAEIKWRSFTQRDDGLGQGTFIHLARELGCEIPAQDFEDDKKLFFEEIQKQKEKEQSAEPKWFKDKKGREYTTSVEFLMSELNKDGYAMLAHDNEGKILKHWTDENGQRKFRMVPNEDFKNSLKHRFLKTYERNARGESVPKLTFASDIWLSSTDKVRFDKVTFDRPDRVGAKDLNLWTDIPTKKVPVNEDALKEYLNFVLEIICCGNKERFNYLMDWTADVFQNPLRKCSIVPVLLGKQGVGKGLFVEPFRLILHDYFIKINTARVLKERFNAEQARKLLTFIDEASWQGDHEEAGILKDLTGNDFMTIEEKFGARLTLPNFSRYIVASNEINAVKIEQSNRRFLAFEVSSAWLPNIKTYESLWRKLKAKGFIENFYSYLMERDISAFSPNRFPRELDIQGFKTKLRSLGVEALFWFDLLFESPAPVFYEGRFMKKGEVYDLFLDYVQKSRHWARGFSQKTFWDTSREIMPILKERNNDRRLKDGNRARVQYSYPFELAESLANTLNIPVPNSFDELSLLVESEFKTDSAPKAGAGIFIEERAH